MLKGVKKVGDKYRLDPTMFLLGPVQEALKAGNVMRLAVALIQASDSISFSVLMTTLQVKLTEESKLLVTQIVSGAYHEAIMLIALKRLTDRFKETETIKEHAYKEYKAKCDDEAIFTFAEIQEEIEAIREEQPMTVDNIGPLVNIN